MKIRPILLSLLTLGIVWGCQTQDPLVRDARNSLQSLDYERALELTEEALEADSSNAQAHYYRASALASIAEDIEPPSDRKPHYEQMRSSMDQAKRFFEEMESTPDEYDMIDEVVTSVWALEHNSGVDLMIDDSLRQSVENPEEIAMSHFENAIIVQPDSSLSYEVLGSVQYQTGNDEKAIETYESALELLDRPSVDFFDFLISLYFIHERYDDARETAMMANELYPEKTLFTQYLADSYLQTGETDRGIALIRDLIADEPDNPDYYFVLGTQLYQAALRHIDEASKLYSQVGELQAEMRTLPDSEKAEKQRTVDSLMAEAEPLEAEGNELADIAIEELENTIELRPDDERAYNVLGVIHQNKASTLFEKRNFTYDNDDLFMQYDQEARENLEEAMVNYERAAEINPCKVEYWDALFQVYATLSMDEEANHADERIEALMAGEGDCN